MCPFFRHFLTSYTKFAAKMCERGWFIRQLAGLAQGFARCVRVGTLRASVKPEPLKCSPLAPDHPGRRPVVPELFKLENGEREIYGRLFGNQSEGSLEAARGWTMRAGALLSGSADTLENGHGCP
jgi:hypothetical protein